MLTKEEVKKIIENEIRYLYIGHDTIFMHNAKNKSRFALSNEKTDFCNYAQIDGCLTRKPKDLLCDYFHKNFITKKGEIECLRLYHVLSNLLTYKESFYKSEIIKRVPDVKKVLLFCVEQCNSVQQHGNVKLQKLPINSLQYLNTILP